MVIQKSITNDFFNFSNLILQTAFGKIGLLFKSQNWVEFLIKAMIVAIISAAFATIVYLRSEGTKIIFSHVKQILQK